MENKIISKTKIVLGIVFVLAGAGLLFDPINAANLYCQNKSLLAILMIIGGGLLFYQRRQW